MSNRRKLRGASGLPLPRCADCHSITYLGVTAGGSPVIHLDHDPGCPAWRGVILSPVKAFAEAEAATGRTVIYMREVS